MRRLIRVLEVMGAATVLMFVYGLVSIWMLPPRAPDLLIVRDPGGEERASAPADAPNVVLVIGCTVRADQLPAYGGPPALMPFLAGVADDGVVVDDLIAAAPWTRPAVTTLLTGHHATAIRMTEPSEFRNMRTLPEQVLTLAQRFQAGGYRTIGVFANPNVHSQFGFARGYDAFYSPRQLWREGNAFKVEGERVVEALDDALAEDDARPVFVTAMFVEAHGPYRGDMAVAMTVGSDRTPVAMTRYRAGLATLDTELARLDDMLTAHELTADNTLFVFVTDHGEGLGLPQHHGQSHGRYLAPSTVRAAWLARGPGITPGRRVTGVVSQVDIAPTLLGLAGLESGGTQGLDLSPVLREGGASGREQAFSETRYAKVDRAAIYQEFLACQVDLGTIGAPQQFVEGCFDRVADPEHADPFEDAPLMDLAVRWRQRQVRLGSRFAEGSAQPDEALGKMLEDLGYGDEGEADP